MILSEIWLCSLKVLHELQVPTLTSKRSILTFERQVIDQSPEEVSLEFETFFRIFVQRLGSLLVQDRSLLALVVDDSSADASRLRAYDVAMSDRELD
jgi:hypothetical protein